MPVVLKDGPLAGKPWPAPVAPGDGTISTRIGQGVKVVYDDTGEIDPVTQRRIFAFRPPKPEVAEVEPIEQEEDDDGE